MVFCPKYRYRIFKNEIAEYTRQQIYSLSQQKGEIEVLELNIQADHVHLVVSIASKYAVSEFMGYLKGKLALRLFHQYEQLGKALLGTALVGTRVLCQHDWAGRGEDPQACPVAGGG